MFVFLEKGFPIGKSLEEILVSSIRKEGATIYVKDSTQLEEDPTKLTHWREGMLHSQGQFKNFLLFSSDYESVEEVQFIRNFKKKIQNNERD